jgi:hypothetical protein
MRRNTSMALMALVIGAAVAVVAPSAGAAGRDSATGAAGGSSWVGTWGTAPTGPPSGPWPGIVSEFENQTLRQVVHTSRGGGWVRVRLSNEFGNGPLVIGDAHVARVAGEGAEIVPESDRRLTFSGRASVTIPR